LDRLGLTKAIEAVINSAAAASETAFSPEIANIDDFLPKDLEINFYRIVQESLSNIVKHSQATAATVRIRRDGRWLRLGVEDNGIGFVTDTAAPKPGQGGFGLLSILERVQLLAGAGQIRSAPGKGTVIEVDIDTGALRDE
jgi:signal transduction histidine kinase